MLTLQIGLIDQGQLVAAFQSWARDGDRPLAEHIAARGVLDREQRAAVEAMVELHLKKHAGDAGRSLAAIPASPSIRESLASFALVETEGSVQRVDLAATLPGEDSDGVAGGYTVGSPTSDCQRFRILRSHARGGLGIVSVALDTQLHREVAVKQIVDNHVDDPVSRARFLLEAEVTGGLEHPGIVPVYGLGTDSDGRPYYAMRFIRGDSLKDAIDRFHGDPASKGDPGRSASGGLELRRLLGRFTGVCNAIDYAHNRGVLHRDIKPSNIIVGDFGETLVVDWGLAKPLGRLEPDVSSHERPLAFSTSGGSTATLPGSAMGTPSYMSPEQAEGDLDRLGPGSDVYSLGATLYSILTGKPPFGGKNIVAVLTSVKKGEFPPPRKLDSSIDKALEAICLKAMALKVEDRYESPRALAGDIERWLADEPVAAYPERRIERLGRWIRQHRTWTFAAAAGLIGISLAATVATALIEGGRRREETARKDAETNFLLAEQAVDDYLTSVSENTLLKQQDSVDIRSLRQELLTSALKYYKSFMNQRGNDPRLRRQLANAYYRVGEITMVIGSRSEAIEAYRSAQALWEPLAAAEPESHELRGHLADCHLAIGKLQATGDDFQAAITSLGEARKIFEALIKAHPDVASYQASLALCLLRTGIIQGDLKSSADLALDTLEQAKSIQERLIAQFPGRPAAQRVLAEIILAMGILHYNRHDNSAALQSFHETQHICQSLVDGITVGPKPVILLDLLAISHYNIAAIHRETGRLDEALQSFGRSLEYRSMLADAHPSVTQFQEHMGKNLAEIAVLEHEARQDEKALASIKRSIAILEKLVQAQPDQPRYQHDLGRSWNIQGYFLDEARQNEPAILAFDRAIAEQSKAVAASPDVDLYKTELCSQLDNLGEQYVDLGKVGEALPHYRREITILKELLAGRPRSQAYALSVAEALSKLGNIQRHAGDSAAARELFFDARSLLDDTSARAPGNDLVQVRLGAALIREACALADLREPEKARPMLERAVKTLSGSMSPSTEETARRAWHNDALWELARILRVLKNEPEAEKVDAARVALWRDQPPEDLATLALQQTSQAALIGYGKTPVPPAALSVRELDLDQAVADLSLAVARGFRDLRTIRSHPDSSILLSRDDVKLLMMDMAFPDRPF